MFSFNVFVMIVLTGFVFIANVYCETQTKKETEELMTFVTTFKCYEMK